MIKEIARELQAERLLETDDSVVVGVSGGPDSMALLHLLVGLNQTLDWRLRIHVAHLNHQLRAGEAEADAAFVQAACDSLQLPCTIDTRDLSAKTTGFSIDMTCRRSRRLIESSSAWIVVCRPEPAGPARSTRPLSACAASRSASGRPSSSGVRASGRILRITALRPSGVR